MTGLKIKNANEIVSAMAKTLENKDFTDMFVKEASNKEEIKEEVKKEIKKEASEKEEDNSLEIVAQFAVFHLVKLANAIDAQGFNEISDEIDLLAKKIFEIK